MTITSIDGWLGRWVPSSRPHATALAAAGAALVVVGALGPWTPWGSAGAPGFAEVHAWGGFPAPVDAARGWPLGVALAVLAVGCLLVAATRGWRAPWPVAALFGGLVVHLGTAADSRIALWFGLLAGAAVALSAGGARGTARLAAWCFAAAALAVGAWLLVFWASVSGEWGSWPTDRLGGLAVGLVGSAGGALLGRASAVALATRAAG